MKDKEEIKEITINTSDIDNINFFYYYIRGSAELVRKIEFTVGGNTYYIRHKSVQQLFKYIDLSYRDVKDIKDYKKRNEILLKSLREANRELVLSVTENNSVIRISSNEFQHIPHRLILRAVERTLGEKKILFTRDAEYDNGMYAVWTTDLRTSNYNFRLWAYNYNDASHGLKMGSGAVILTCRNGIVRYRNHMGMRIVHRNELENVENKIVEFVNDSLSSYTELDTIIENAKSVIVNIEKARGFIVKQNFPNKVKYSIAREISSEKVLTLWKLCQVLTHTATYTRDMTHRYRFELMKLGGRVLEDQKLIEQLVVVG